MTRPVRVLRLEEARVFDGGAEAGDVFPSGLHVFGETVYPGELVLVTNRPTPRLSDFLGAPTNALQGAARPLR
jgi:hypothetical protein